MEGSVAKLQTGLTGVQTGLTGVQTGLLEIRQNNEPIQGKILRKSTTNIRIEGAGYVIAYTSRTKFTVNIDGKISEQGINNAFCSWLCRPYAYTRGDKYFIGADGLVSVYEPEYVYNGFESTTDSFGLRPIRFNNLLAISSNNTFDIYYALDPT